MPIVLRRALVALSLIGAGALVGALIGRLHDAAALDSVIGAVIGAVVYGSVDALHATRLLRWLRGPLTGPAPRGAALWGEIGYRVERSLRQREAAIAREADRLQQFLSAIEASPNGVLMLDANDQIEWCNRVAADHFGLDPHRDREQRITNLVRSPAFVAYLQSAAPAQSLTFTTAGDPRTLQVLLRRYGDGQRLVMSQDVTERERNEAMRRDFVANVSHEIRSPLTVLAGFVETLATLELGAAERRRVLALMAQQTDRMQALVADLLTLARLEGSPRPDPDCWHPVAELLAQVEADARALSGSRHRIGCDTGPPADIAGDRNELLSAVGNLMGNAVRYTPDGGSIRLAFSIRDDGAGVFEVADTGIGIAREHLARLTERFYRVDGSRSRETGGTGLGLSIVKHVAQRHGGEVDIDSEPGRGSRFRLVLPSARIRARSGSASPRTAGEIEPARPAA